MYASADAERTAVLLVNHDHSYTAWPTVTFAVDAAVVSEVDKATDPDAIRPMIQQRAEAIRQKWLAGLSGDAEGLASVGLRLSESTSGLTRAGDRRALTLRTDAFNARVLDAQRELTTRAANGDAEAVRTFGALLEEGVRSGFYGPTDAAKQQQAFQAEVQGAQVLRMVRDNPGAVAGVLADPARFTALRADQRERFVTAAATRQQAMAAQSIAADSRAEAARRAGDGIGVGAHERGGNVGRAEVGAHAGIEHGGGVAHRAAAELPALRLAVLWRRDQDRPDPGRSRSLDGQKRL